MGGCSGGPGPLIAISGLNSNKEPRMYFINYYPLVWLLNMLLLSF
jgi:hypothetical protein